MAELDFFYNQVDVVVDNTQQLHHLLDLDCNLSVCKQLPLVSKKYVLFLKQNIQVIDTNYFLQIQWLINQNNYLDVLKHPTWILFNTENVRLHAHRDYWSLNLRPTHGFDDSSWRSYD
jgi:hypothetical protein